MSKPLFAAVLICCLCGTNTFTHAQEQPAPVVFQCDGTDLAQAKARLEAGDKNTKNYVKELLKDADKALKVGTFSVMTKEPVPPTGDKHDYMSLSPYWWPDPSKPDGKPYIRKDGEFNPERAKYDLDALEAMGDAVESLSLAYYFTGNEDYAKKATELIRVWFIDPQTKMNPNLRFAQFVPGITELRSSGIIEGGRFRRIVDADGLMKGSKSWTEDDSKEMKAWFAELLKFLLESDMGQMEANQPNNHGTWYGVQTVTYALYLGDQDLARKLIQKNGPERIAKQIQPDGTQPYDYSGCNIRSHIELAMLAQRIGVDLWGYKTEDGRSLKLALDWLIPYATGEREWPYKQITEAKMKEMATVLRRAANGFHD